MKPPNQPPDADAPAKGTARGRREASGQSTLAAGKGRRARSGAKSLGQSAGAMMPMEWMDPMNWRLPSGKALAEFALQAGFLAPQMLDVPLVRRTRPVSSQKKAKTAQTGLLEGGAGPAGPDGVRNTR